MRTELEERKNYLKISGADGDIDERDQMLEDISLQNRAQAEADAIRLRQLTGDVDFDATPTTTGVNPFKDIDTGVGEFDTGTNIVDDIDTDIGTMKTTAPIETKTDLEKDFPGWTNAEIIQGYKDSPAGAWDTGQWGPQVDDIDTSYDVFSPEIDDAMARKGVPVYDERLGWINSVTEQPVADPNAIDSVLTGGSAEALTSHYQKQLE